MADDDPVPRGELEALRPYENGWRHPRQPAPQAPEAGACALPPDPFGRVDAASVALAESYHGMISAGIPKDSVERIIGHWLANLPGDSRSQVRE